MITCGCGEHLWPGHRCFGCGMVGRVALVIALVVAPVASAKNGAVSQVTFERSAPVAPAGEVSQVTFDRSTVATVAGCTAGVDLEAAVECIVETLVPTQPAEID